MQYKIDKTIVENRLSLKLLQNTNQPLKCIFSKLYNSGNIYAFEMFYH